MVEDGIWCLIKKYILIKMEILGVKGKYLLILYLAVILFSCKENDVKNNLNSKIKSNVNNLKDANDGMEKFLKIIRKKGLVTYSKLDTFEIEGTTEFKEKRIEKGGVIYAIEDVGHGKNVYRIRNNSYSIRCYNRVKNGFTRTDLFCEKEDVSLRDIYIYHKDKIIVFYYQISSYGYEYLSSIEFYYKEGRKSVYSLNFKDKSLDNYYYDYTDIIDEKDVPKKHFEKIE